MNKTEYVRNTIDVVRQIETRFLELGARLFKIQQEKLWLDSYDSYLEFLDAAHISKAMASMLASIHRSYVIEGGKTQEQLTGIGYSNLYSAIPLIAQEGIDKAVAKAETLTRSEIKDEVREQKHGTHTHTVGTTRWGCCETCGKFVQV